MCRVSSVISAGLLGLLYVAGAALAADSVGTAIDFPQDKQQVEVKLQRGDDSLLVPVWINGRDAGLLVLDTNATHSVIDPSVAAELHLVPVAHESGTAGGLGGNEQVSTSLYGRGLDLAGRGCNPEYVHRGSGSEFVCEAHRR